MPGTSNSQNEDRLSKVEEKRVATAQPSSSNVPVLEAIAANTKGKEGLSSDSARSWSQIVQGVR